ncbi:MAG: right-handed parallel beta-helix repeat-containing protein [Clostridia bacterium]|nr:right-handed parallel beta-helix repeat-containing protein [Clostridia bacterium]
MKKRILSFILALSTILLAIPATVFPVMAAESAESDPIVLSSTIFAPNQEGTWPIFDEYDTTAMNTNDYVGVTYRGGWQIGYKHASGNSSNFTPYEKLIKATGKLGEDGEMILTADTGYWTQWGGLYIKSTASANLMFSGVDLDEATGYLEANVAANATVRYTAKETGTIRVKVNELYFYSDSATYFAVYHNGVRVHDPIMAVNAKSQIVNGAFVSKTASNNASLFTTVTLDVQKGDSIDFVSHANPDFNASNLEELGLTQFTKTEYVRSKRGLSDYEFQIDYIAEKTSYSTRFSPDEESTFPVFEGYSVAAMENGDSVGVTYPGAWQIGYRDPNGETANFTAYDKLYKVNSSGQMILSAGSSYWSDYGGVYITGVPTLMFSGMSYTDDYTSVTSHNADPVIRYTAEYTGMALIRLNELYFYANNAAYLEILHNGVPLTDPYLSTDAQYRVQDGAYTSAGAANKGADLGTLVLELTEGDTIDFVSRANDDFNASNIESLGLTKFDGTEYDYAKRGMLDFDFEIVYRSEKDGGKAENFAGTTDTTLPEPLFVWYDASGTMLEDSDIREAAGNFPDTSGSTDIVFSSLVSLFDWLYRTGGSYAEINPTLIANGTISETDNYANILAKYKTYLASFTSLSFPSGWKAGVRAGSSFTAFDRLCFFSDSNLFAVGQAGGIASALVDYSYNGNLFVTSAQFTAALDAFIANAASITPSGTAASDLRLEYDGIPEGMTLPTQGTDPLAAVGAAMKHQGGNLFLCPSANGGIASYAYTVPSGYDRPILSLTANAVRFDGDASAFHYAIAVNGEVVWPVGATMSSAMADHDSMTGWQLCTSAEDLTSTLASLHFEVESGDVVELCVARAYEGGAEIGDVCVGMDLTATTDNYHDVNVLDIIRSGKYLHRGVYEFGSTVTLADLNLPDTFGANGVYINNTSLSEELPTSLTMYRNYRITDMVLQSSASVSITSAFAVNIYVQAQSSATAAGVVIDGEKVPGVLQGNNVYKCTLPVVPKDLPAMEVSYKAYQTVDGKDTVNADPITLSAFDLLALYEASEDETTALLAKTVRYYSLAARDYFINQKVTLSDDVKNALRGRADASAVGTNDTAILTMVDAYKAGTAYQPYPDGTDVSAFDFKFNGITLKLDNTLGFLFRTKRTDDTLFGEPSLRLRVTDANDNVRYYADPASLFDEEGKEMLYFVGNLPAAEYASEFYFTLVDGNGTAQSATLTYSAYAYIARTFNTASGDDSALHYLLRGIYALGEATSAYLEVHSLSYDANYTFDIGDGGDALVSNDPVLKEVTYDPSTATVLSANEFFNTALESGSVYKVSDNTLTLTDADGGSYNANGAILIASGGLIIDGCQDVTVSDLVVVGPVIIRNSSNVILENCQILAPTQTSVSVEATAESIVLNACRMIGTTAVANAADELTVMNSYLGFSGDGVRDTASNGTTVQNCRLVGTGSGSAIYSTASESAFRFNTILQKRVTSSGIVLKGDGSTLNVLVAQNVISGTRSSMSISGLLNASVVLNSAVTIEASDNKNLYLCDNAIGGRLVLTSNNYLLADGNRFPDDTMDHTTVSTDNQNTNGDSLMDVNARVDVGANEDLLPHVDKDLFLGMERKEAVKDVTSATKLDVYKYITTNSLASNSHYIVVAPGAYLLKDSDYNSKNGLELTTSGSNGDRIYAYGVYAEHESGLYRHITLSDVEDVTIKGLSIGYAAQSVGQVQILEKIDNTHFLAVAPAGMTADLFVNSTSSTYLHRTGRGEEYIFCDLTGFSAVDNGDGTVTVTASATYAELLSVGDTLTCRATGKQTVTTSRCADILYQDMTVFGNSGGLCFVESDNTGYVTYHRILDTNRNGRVIDQATYDAYEALEAEYGVDLDIHVDEAGRLRGAKQLVGSVDATHVISCAYGSQIISCIFENMCDDGTNQKSTHGRLASVTDNGDGTTTLVYKSSISMRNVAANYTSTGICPDFEIGDRVFIYTAAGQRVCDTPALSATVEIDSYKSTYRDVERTIVRKSVTVKTDDVNFDALTGYDLTIDTAEDEHKVLIDNRTRTSNSFRIENTVIDGTRSRGLLIKSSNGVIRNCTLRNIAKVGIAVLYEIYWGESGVSENILIENNLFDNVSYNPHSKETDNYQHYPIYIAGLGGGTLQEDYLLYTDITVRGNVIRNRHSDHAVYVRAAKNLAFYNNDFGNALTETADDPKATFKFNGALNVELSGNTYSSYLTDIQQAYYGPAYDNIYGLDVSKYPYHDENNNLFIRYQDTYTFPVAIEAIENAAITSKVTGTDTMDANLLVLQEDGKSVYADGCGTATIRLVDGRTVNITIDPSDISLFFVTGQSNASADHSFTKENNPEEYEKYHDTYADYFIRTAPTMAYFTWTGQSLSLTGTYNPENSVTDTLDWDNMGSQAFVDPKVFSIPVGSTTFGNAGWSAALAHEWVEQTGERVWIVNASHGGHGIAEFAPSEDGTPVDNDYYQAVAVFNEALETLYAEVDAGHFTLNHMAYYWFHGCADYQQTEEYYTEGFAKMHTAMQADVVYNHAGVEKKLEYCGIMDIRSKHDSSGNSYAEKYLTGPRLSHYQAAGATDGVFENVFIASNVTQRWLGDDQNVVDYFLETYGSVENFKAIFGYDMPTTRWELHPNVHYLMMGHNEMGMDCARNTLRIINALGTGKTYVHDYVDNSSISITLVGRDGHTPITDTIKLQENNGNTLLLPLITPTWRTMDGVSLVSETAGFTFVGYELYATDTTKSQITFSVYVGETNVQTYTMAIEWVSSFTQNAPLYTYENGSYTLTGMQSPWSVGYVNLSDKSFTPYSAISTSGWIGINTNSHSQYGSFTVGSWNASMQPSMLGAATFCYTATKDGSIAISAEKFDAATYSGGVGTFLAVMVNGNIVWPTSASSYSLPTSTADTTWQYMPDSTDGTAELNALWADVRLTVNKDDLVQFCLISDTDRSITGGETKTNSQPILHPVVTYVESSSFTHFTPVVNEDNTATMRAPWSMGYLSISSGNFTPYTKVVNGWLTANDSAHSTYGSFWTNGWRASMQSNMVAANTICYTAEKAGTLSISAEKFDAAITSGAAGTFLAVMVNGVRVWPTSGSVPYSLPTTTTSTDWQFITGTTTDSTDETATLNALWADVRLTVNKNDLVQFCLISDTDRSITGGSTKTNSQPILLPGVTYVD